MNRLSIHISWRLDYTPVGDGRANRKSYVRAIAVARVGSRPGFLCCSGAWSGEIERSLSVIVQGVDAYIDHE